MERPRRKIDRCAYERQTSQQIRYVKSVLKRAEKYANDPDKASRMTEALCKVCYYDQSRIGGAACTSTQCAGCETVIHSGNTCIDILCPSCATKHQLCKHCGADVNLVHKRKPSLPTP